MSSLPIKSLSHRQLEYLIYAIVGVPFIVLAIQMVGRSWYPTGDWAITALRVHDVGTSYTPLVGPYSRYDWNHPGPLIFYVLAMFYRLFGSANWAMLIGAVLVNLSAILVSLRIVRIVSGLRLMFLTAAVVLVLSWGFSTSRIIDPWNPYLSIFPFFAFIISSWATRQDSKLAVWCSIVTGTFIVQSHIGYAPSVLLGWGFVSYELWKRRDVKLAAKLIIAAFILWLPVLIDQLFFTRNITDLLAYFSSSHNPVGLHAGFGIVSQELTGIAPWMDGKETFGPYGNVAESNPWFLLAYFLTFLGVIAVSFKRKLQQTSFLVLLLLFGIIGTWSVSKISDLPSDYLVRFWWALSAVITLGFIWTVSELITPNRLNMAKWLGVATLVVLSIHLVMQTPDTIVPIEDQQSELAAIVKPTLKEMPANATVFIEGRGPLGGWLRDALAYESVSHGHEIKFLPELKYRVGKSRTQICEVCANVMPVYVIATGESIKEFESVAGEDVAIHRGVAASQWRVIAQYHPTGKNDYSDRDAVVFGSR